MKQWTALTWVAISELFSLSLWFSAAVILPELRGVWQLSPLAEAWVSASVPIGFVIGAFVSAFFGLADRYNARKIFAGSALIGAVLNGLLILVDHAFVGITLRMLTGITLAGVYPTAVKLISTWFPHKRGLSMGILVASLTLGSSLPHFVTIFFSVNWRWILLTSSFLALIAAAIVNWILVDAPNSPPQSSFSLKLVKKVISNKPVMLANYGYFGHMWELYGMWTWLPAFFVASLAAAPIQVSSWVVAIASFASIGVAGAIGSILGGLIADKIGRSQLTIISLSISAVCSMIIGLTFGHALWLSFAIALIWGGAVIADSAQFSAAVSEFAEQEYLGTALTFQMCIGFLITIFSINLVTILQRVMGWEWVFFILSIGPILGIISMLKFKHYEEIESRPLKSNV